MVTQVSVHLWYGSRKYLRVFTISSFFAVFTLDLFTVQKEERKKKNFGHLTWNWLHVWNRKRKSSWCRGADSHTPCSLPVGCHLTFWFLGGRQHPEDAHGLVSFVDALVLHLLDVRQGVHGAAEVGFPRLGVTVLALHEFPCTNTFDQFHSSSDQDLFLICMRPSSLLSSLLTCVDGPLLEQASVLVHLPAVTSCVLPWDGEHRPILLDIKETMSWREDVQRVQTWVTKWSASLWASTSFVCVCVLL